MGKELTSGTPIVHPRSLFQMLTWFLNRRTKSELEVDIGQTVAYGLIALLRHGTTEMRVLVWSTDDCYILECADAGVFIEPGTGIRAPSSGINGSTEVKFANSAQLRDRLRGDQIKGVRPRKSSPRA